jgi:hypothetical protein
VQPSAGGSEPAAQPALVRVADRPETVTLVSDRITTTVRVADALTE